MWHKKDAALFEVHINKRKGNKAKVAKAQAHNARISGMLRAAGQW